MRISFVIPVKNGRAFIGRCIEHIQAEKGPDDEIIVVDNGSTDDTVEIAKAAGADAVAVRPGDTIAALRNHGAAASQGDILAFIDADCLVCPDWRTEVERVLSDPGVSATGSFYDLPDETTWVERAWWAFRPEHEHPTTFLISGNFIVRKDVYESVNGFDESLVTEEDTDISRRLDAAGHVMIEAPSVRVVHLGNAKTLKHFFGKEKWHAASMVDMLRSHHIDRPMMLTGVFILGWIVAVLAPFFIGIHAAWVSPAAVMLAPVFTATYKVLKHGHFEYVLHLIPLYFVVYVVRTLVLLEVILGKGRA